ncbi:hypothetical protein ACWPKS_16000 [Coraliomargarita sp. W4R72]
MSIGQRTCVTCPEPPDYDEEADGPLPKYRIKCGKPTIAISYVSTETAAELCGHSEYIDPSEPPKKYRIETVSASGTITQGAGGAITRTCSVSGSWTFDAEDCTDEKSYTYNYTIDGVSEASDCSSSEVKSTFSGYGSRVIGGADWGCDDPFYETPVENDISTLVYKTDYDGLDTAIEGTATLTLSDEDTEEDAVDRATPTTGTKSTSIYELRTTTFTFTHRTVKYTATASGLVKGVSYHGCIRIQRREAYSGTEPEDADLDWYDVESDEIVAFPATSDEKDVAAAVDLPIAQGWEYRIEGAYIYPVSSPCECPTSYEEPAE